MLLSSVVSTLVSLTGAVLSARALAVSGPGPTLPVQARDSDPSLVLTPAGYKSAGNVHQVPHGATVSHIGTDMHVTDKNGALIKIVSGPSAATRTTSSPIPAQTGWITYASWVNPNATLPIKTFSADFVVPEPPQVYTNQTVFLFPALLPVDGTSILQPVLQYGSSGAGGGEYWSVAMWYVFDGDYYYVTPLVQVSPGQSLQGILSMVSDVGGYYTYTTSMSPVTAAGALTVNIWVQLGWATLTLEAYGVTDAKSYSAGTTTFNNILLQTTAETSPTAPSWSVINDEEDGITTTINQAALNGKGVVVINY
uniref:Uncharacterized protein n=1 Tax=Mycena chlorophos TaxID=658473 RepID=A0ABQ0M426_MYCCL|nr:predicted protein [Mycena chlorophos]